MLNDSNRPLRLEFYPSLRPERAVSTDRSGRVQSLAAELVHSRPGSVLFSDLSLDKEASPNRWCKTRACGGLSTSTAYSRLGMGFSRGSQINMMPTSYTQYQTTLRGFYLSGNVGRQGLTLGGAQQSVGFQGLSLFGRATQVGRTTPCLACTQEYNRFVTMIFGR